MHFSHLHIHVTVSSIAAQEVCIQMALMIIACLSPRTLRHLQDLSKSPKSVKKLLPKRKPERKQSEEEFALRKSKSLLNYDEIQSVWKTSVDRNLLALLVRVNSYLEKIAELLWNCL